MIYAIYFVAFYLGFLAFALAQLLDRHNAANRPANPASMRWAARFGAACVLALTIFGLSKFTWYVPLLAYLSVALTAGTVRYRARRSPKALSIEILCGASSVFLTILSFQLVD